MDMDMERVRPSLAALLFLMLVLSPASAIIGDDDDDAASAAVVEKQYHRRADEPYMLVAFQNKDGEEVRLLSDQRSELSPGVSGFANRSGNWFYAIRDGDGERRRLPLPVPQSSNRSGGLWNTLGALANTTAAASGDIDADPAANDDDGGGGEQGYMLVGMQTCGGDKIRLVVVADQRYFSFTGFAQGFIIPPRWFFREDERHRLLLSLGSNGFFSSHGGTTSSSSHAEVVASNVLTAMMNAGKAFRISASQSSHYLPSREK